MCKITAICVWAALLLNRSCCHSMVFGYISNGENPQEKWINGTVFLRCPQSENDLCRDHCSDPQTGGKCWPSTALKLRNNATTGTCNDILFTKSRSFISEIVHCDLEGGRYACHIHLDEMESTVYLGAQLAYGGRILGFRGLNGEERPAPSGKTATLYFLPWYPQISNLNIGLNFALRVRCVRSVEPCDAVQLLVVKHRCT